jgi:antitoxin HicB
MNKKNPHAGGNFDDFLKEEGIFEQVEALALKRALALRVQDLMTGQKLTKVAMASRMATSRAAVNRLLDGENTSVTLGTLNRAARALGRKVKIELVPA